MECSTSGLPVNRWLLEFTQVHVHWVSDAIQPSHPLSSPSPLTFNLSQYQGLFKWVSSPHQVTTSIGVSASASVLPVNIQDWFPLGWTGWISLKSKGLSRDIWISSDEMDETGADYTEWNKPERKIPIQYQFSSVQLLSRVRLFVTPWIAAHQASLSITNSRSSLRLTSIESVMPPSHLILCRPLFLLPPVPPSIRVFSNEFNSSHDVAKVLEFQL